MTKNRVLFLAGTITAGCWAYSLATRFTDILYAPMAEKITTLLSFLILAVPLSAFLFLALIKPHLDSLHHKHILRQLAVCALLVSAFLLAFYESPPFPEQHQLVISAAADRNPLSAGNQIEIPSISTVSLPYQGQKKIPITQFLYEGTWAGLGDNYGLSHPGNQLPASLTLERFMQAGIQIRFRTGPNSGIAEVFWDGNESTVDLYSPEAGSKTVYLKPNLDWHKADPVRKILVGGAFLADSLGSLVLVFSAFIIFQRLFSRQPAPLIQPGLLFVFLAIFVLLQFTATRFSHPAGIQNPQIESLVRAALNKPAGNLYPHQLLRIVELDASGKRIANLDGIEALSNLEKLNLSNNQIQDISALGKLRKLKELNLRNNAISDLGPLAHLQKLEYLNIHSNPDIASIQPLQALSNLETLIMANVPIRDELHILDGFDDLRYLNLRGCGLDDLGPIANMTGLRYLNLHSNPNIPSIQPLAQLANLKTLILANVPVSEDLAVVENMTDLEYLNLRNTGLSDIAPLAGLVNLEYLNLHSNPAITSIQPIRNLKQLQHLILRDIPLMNETAAIEQLANLRSLNIRNCRIADISFLGRMMQRGILQNNPNRAYTARVDIRDNPITAGEQDAYAPIRDHWENIADRQPIALPFYAELAEPAFSHASGFYKEDFYLSLSAPDPDAVIHYTLDGSDPHQDSPIYSQPIFIQNRQGEPDVYSVIETISADWNKPDIPVDKATVVRAIAISSSSDQSSPVATKTFFVGPDFLNRYSLPILSLASDPANLFDEKYGIYVLGEAYQEVRDLDLTEDEKQTHANFNQHGYEWERPISIEFFNTGMESLFTQNGGVRIHGGGSRRNPQKSLRVYAGCEYDDQCLFDYPFFQEDFEPQSENQTPSYESFILRNAGQDWMKSMIRDYVSHLIISETGLDYQKGYPVIVFINGEYWGIYLLQERYDEHYLKNHYGLSENQASILRQNGDLFRGNESDASQYDEIVDFYTTHDLSNPENYEYLNTKIDIEDYMNYLTANIFLGNNDWPNVNVYLWRKSVEEFDPKSVDKSDGRWRWMINDMDFCFGLQGYGEGYEHDTLAHAQMEGWSGDLFRSLLENEDFRTQFIKLFSENLNSIFLPERVTAIIVQASEEFKPEMERFFNRWSTDPESIQKWENEIEILLEFANKRPEIMRQLLIEHFDRK